MLLSLPSPQQTSPSRRNRKCGDCEACLLKIDCGRCDFCQDKPKFGGRNLKRQKCRWRQCLYFAMVCDASCSSSVQLCPPVPCLISFPLSCLTVQWLALHMACVLIRTLRTGLVFINLLRFQSSMRVYGKPLEWGEQWGCLLSGLPICSGYV